jgi:hypothetical protein
MQVVSFSQQQQKLKEQKVIEKFLLAWRNLGPWT